MKKNKLGESELEVTEFTLGCWALAGGMNWGFQDESDSIKAVHAALDAGIHAFDTAEGYGDGLSEQILGKALGNRRDEVIIATKVSSDHLEPTQHRLSCEKSLRRLRKEVIDFYQIHWPPVEAAMEEVVETMEALRSEGKIRAYGVCNFGPGQLADYLSCNGMKTTNQVAYNLLARAVELEIIPTVGKARMNILAYSPLMQGLLTGKFKSLDEVPEARQRTRHFSSEKKLARHGEPGHEALTRDVLEGIRHIAVEIDRSLPELALRWLLDRRDSRVSSVIVGARNAEQVKRNMAAAAQPLSDETIRALDTVTEPLKNAMGSNADLWESPGRIA